MSTPTRPFRGHMGFKAYPRSKPFTKAESYPNSSARSQLPPWNAFWTHSSLQRRNCWLRRGMRSRSARPWCSSRGSPMLPSRSPGSCTAAGRRKRLSRSSERFMEASRPTDWLPGLDSSGRRGRSSAGLSRRSTLVTTNKRWTCSSKPYLQRATAGTRSAVWSSESWTSSALMIHLSRDRGQGSLQLFTKRRKHEKVLVGQSRGLELQADWGLESSHQAAELLPITTRYRKRDLARLVSARSRQDIAFHLHGPESAPAARESPT